MPNFYERVTAIPDSLPAQLSGVAGCGDGCFDCRDSGCGCKSGEICSESEQLPASMSPEAVHHTVWACKSEEKKAP